MATTNSAKTPVRPRHARPPLTPSAITTNFNALSLSPSKSTINTGSGAVADSSNPFLERKTSSSPAKRSRQNSYHGVVNMEHMKQQAQRGIIRPGGLETKFDVVKHDYIVPVKGDGSNGGSAGSSPRKRSSSVGASIGRSRKLSSSQNSVGRYPYIIILKSFLTIYIAISSMTGTG